MINDRLAALTDYPFRRLADLLQGIEPPGDVTSLIMSIGEPQHRYPALVAETLTAHADDWGKYPPTVGIRLDEESEALGSDQSELGLEAYPEFGQGSQRI